MSKTELGALTRLRLHEGSAKEQVCLERVPRPLTATYRLLERLGFLDRADALTRTGIIRRLLRAGPTGEQHASTALPKYVHLSRSRRTQTLVCPRASRSERSNFSASLDFTSPSMRTKGSSRIHISVRFKVGSGDDGGGQMLLTLGSFRPSKRLRLQGGREFVPSEHRERRGFAQSCWRR
jgi:hypothetical protein